MAATRLNPIASNIVSWVRDAAGVVNRAWTEIESMDGALTADIAAINAAMPHTVPVTVTADATVAATVRWIINNKSGSACVLTLPAAADFEGRELHVKTIQAQAVNSANSNVVPLIGGAAGSAILTGTAGKWATLVSDGTNWVIMAAA